MALETVAPSCAKLEDLPSEILTLIATYLDAATATSLSVTSSVLQPYAEKRLWEALSIQPRELIPNQTTRPSRGPAAAGNSETIHVCTINPITLTDEGYCAALLLGKAVRTMNAKLDRYPWRASAVRSLDLSLRHTVPSELVYLFARVAGSLTELQISMPYSAIAIPDVAAYVPLTQIFSSLATPFASLDRVWISVQRDPDELVAELLAAAPRLKHLHLHNRFEPRLYGSLQTAAGPDETRIWPPTGLESLTVEHPATIAPLLSVLVSRSPALRRVALIDHTFAWAPQRGEDLLSALGALEDLDSVELPCTTLPHLPDGFGRAQHLTVTWNAEALLQRDAVTFLIPPFPRLRTIQLDISLYMPRASFIHILRASPYRQAASLLRSITPVHLAETPHLTTMYCPSQVGLPKTGTGITPSILSHTDHAFNGMIVYSFRNEATSDELIHLRRHTTSSDAPCKGQRCLICPVGWDDQAWFRGREVSAAVLFAAYAAGNVDIKRLTPGRGLTMEQAGWGVLRYWLDTCEGPY